MTRRNVTIQDVASRSGFSTATVSRALNNPELVSEHVKAAVQEAAQTLGYIGNNAARMLRQNRSRQFGAIIPTLNYAIYAGFVEALQKRCSTESFTLLLATSDYSLDTEAEHGLKLVRAGVEGLVLVGNLRRQRFATLLASAGVPSVNTYVYDRTCNQSTIGIDNVGVFRSMVDYLAGLGHREIGLIAGRSHENDRVSTRIAGFQKGLAAHGLEDQASRIVREPYTIDAGRSGLRKLLAAHSLTAVVCGSDMLALGAMLECRDMGLTVPRDISILGLDNLDLATFVEPGLTTFAVPSVPMGELAAEHLLARCNGSKAIIHARFDADLIVRGSTGPAPALSKRRALRR